MYQKHVRDDNFTHLSRAGQQRGFGPANRKGVRERPDWPKERWLKIKGVSGRLRFFHGVPAGTFPCTNMYIQDVMYMIASWCTISCRGYSPMLAKSTLRG